MLKHRKINILDIAQDLYATGDRLSVASTSFGTVGVNICADNFPDSLAVGGDGRVLAEAPFGESAEGLVVIDLKLTSRTVTGTEIAPSLREKGHAGP